MSSSELWRPAPDRRRSHSPALPSEPAINAPSEEMQVSPLTDSQWRQISEAYRPKEWNPHPRRDKPLPLPPPHHRAMPSSSLYPRESPSLTRSSPPRRKQRPSNLNDSSSYAQSGSNFLQTPHLDDPLLTSRSAPDEYVYASRANKPYQPLRRKSSEYSQISPLSGLPRSPTNQPAGGRRTQSASGADLGFEDDEQFRLFIDATTGLGPFPNFRQASIAESPIFLQHSQHAGTQQRPQQASSIVSPLGETPTTMHVLRGLAQMPHHLLRSPDEPVEPGPSRSFVQRSRSSQRSDEEDEDGVGIDISDSGLGMFTSTPFPQRDNNWLDTERPLPDDELPSYATSQAEAHAAQRQSAARRAEELQRRWREGGRKYGAEF